MASNVSRERLMFYAAAGGLGGFGAWGASEPFAYINGKILGVSAVWYHDIILGALTGLFIAMFLASIEALSVSQWRQVLRGIRAGAIIGAIGGAIGLLVAEIAFDIVGGFIGRVLGWSVLGILVGLGVGWATRSMARLRNGAVGGLLGGAAGGMCYQVLTAAFPQSFGRAIALILIGALIGFFIGLVAELLKRGWLMVVRSQSRNAREGREYPLDKPVTSIGRAEECDIGLFGDQAVHTRHAVIRREGKSYFVTPAGGSEVIVNRQPIRSRQALKSGDRVEIGGTLFLFRERSQAARG